MSTGDAQIEMNSSMKELQVLFLKASTSVRMPYANTLFFLEQTTNH